MNRISFPVIAAFALLAHPAAADIVRHPAIPSILLGTWAEATEQCATKDQSNVSIESTNTATAAEAAWCVGSSRRRARAARIMPSMRYALVQKTNQKLKRSTSLSGHKAMTGQ
jgi:hypothetical protein